ncbi:secondary thiamine-phosphate synthase enzyme YjbQ [Methylicorpusculum sp.]|uniref:secondary thiamine-phosphate synthase enzyme YjbQ n=1 Tax=Methylicorpusculum sp. TaxID=2713644 RepID=UPI00272EFDBC|nr:secondary thiamine-phosphate synthase enzyme YjbQ [Methylicorpusculum sp.]MDP2180609.1 secondary thiamine-phosphate synthase enzyme YjbQ [Methylicorpusculum sp.]MDP3530472.1 secondary thiamine-phosphate synthase enzyme YjbQ [Methylicorpusculum sp.]MDZ4150061.1 secondary thiamine-phosphate synthase enzyme YjbQ [Methylicorpusculum sp.]
MWLQKTLRLSPKKRGFHLITSDIVSAVPEIGNISTGLLHVFIQHTSASLAINENADADVRRDMEAYFSRLAPENEPYFLHTLEGTDDMPAHLKAVLIGCQLTLPIGSGRLQLGTWQGVYLNEHRDHAGVRTLIITLHGQNIS